MGNTDGKSQKALAGRRRRDVGAAFFQCSAHCRSATEYEGVRLGMTRIHPERSDSDLSDHSLAADVLLRQEPDEEEDEEEDEGDDKEDDDDEGDDDGYSK